MANRRESNRKKPLKGIKSSAWSRGFGIAKLSVTAGLQLAGHGIGQMFADPKDRDAGRVDLLKIQAKLLADELHKLKGSMMKVGQTLSMFGEHFLPKEVVDILKTLQSDSQPLEWKAMHRVLVRELGPEKLAMLEINETPHASASMGQVHRARCKVTGQELCLKIQYPGVAKSIDSDLKALRSLLLVTRLLPKNAGFDDVFKEVRLMLHRETDYRKEAETTLHFRELLKDDSRYVVPDVRLDLSTGRILTTTFQMGVAIKEESLRQLSQERRDLLGLAALELFFREFFEWGVVQTDPHFGNYLLKIDPLSGQDQLVLLDFGATRKFSQTFLNDYYDFVWTAFDFDRASMRRACIRLGFLMETDDDEQVGYIIDIARLVLEPFLSPNPDMPNLWTSKGSYRWGVSDLPARATSKGFKAAYAMKFRSPPREVLFLHRKLGGVFTFLSVCKAELNGAPIVDAYMRPKL
jgi:predicted unusual protein kinase regulating ubiquinone biosynthesis (AarF/ABC1/UbiB family)